LSGFRYTLSRQVRTRSERSAAAAASYSGSDESAKRCSSPGYRKSSASSGRRDELASGIEILGEELVALFAVDLNRDARGPSGAELGERKARVHEQRAAGALAGLRKLLGDRDAEREAGVDGIVAEVGRDRHSALRERAEALLARERHSLVDGGERAPVEQLGRVDGVAGPTQLVGERLDAVREPLNVVVEHDVRHLPYLRLIDPLV
jgi:hypothetical protein